LIKIDYKLYMGGTWFLLIKVKNVYA